MLFKCLHGFCLLFVISHIFIFDYLNAMKVFTHHLDVWALWRNLHTENICSWIFLSIEQRPFTVWWLISSMWRQRGKNHLMSDMLPAVSTAGSVQATLVCPWGWACARGHLARLATLLVALELVYLTVIQVIKLWPTWYSYVCSRTKIMKNQYDSIYLYLDASDAHPLYVIYLRGL